MSKVIFMPYIILFYLNMWIVYTINFYGTAQIFTLLIAFIFFINIVPSRIKNFKVKKINTILLLPFLLFFSDIIQFFQTTNYSHLGRSIFLLSTVILFLSQPTIKLKNPIRFLNFFIIAYIITNILALTYFTNFSVAHSKFLPAIGWAYMTSNNISYYVTLLGLMLISLSHVINQKTTITMLLFILFTFIHFSKAHIVIMLVSILLSIILIAKVKVRFTLSILLFLLIIVIQFVNLQLIVDDLDLKPISKIYYGFSDLPNLINANGWQDGIILFISEVGDETRANIYLNGFNNLYRIGIFGSDPSLSNILFNSRDYHNTFLYLAYEFGVIGIIYYFAFNLIILKLSLNIVNKYLKVIFLTSFFYFNFRSFFISIDLVWILIYWYLLFHIYYLGKKNESLQV